MGETVPPAKPFKLTHTDHSINIILGNLIAAQARDGQGRDYSKRRRSESFAITTFFLGEISSKCLLKTHI